MGGWSGPSKNGEEHAWKPNKEAVQTTINYAISTGGLDNKQDGAEEEGTQRSDESGGGAESDANEEAQALPTFILLRSSPHLNPAHLSSISPMNRKLTTGNSPLDSDVSQPAERQQKILFSFSQGSHFFSSTILLKVTSESEQLEQWDFSFGTSIYNYVLVLVIDRSAIWPQPGMQ